MLRLGLRRRRWGRWLVGRWWVVSVGSLVLVVLLLVMVEATYSRTTAYSSVLKPLFVGSGAASLDSEGDVAAGAGWRSFARAHVAAYTAVARQSAVRFIVAFEVVIIWWLVVQ